MRLAAFSHNGKSGIGIVDGAGADAIIRPVPPEANCPQDLVTALHEGDAALARLKQAAEKSAPLALNQVQLHAPIKRPGKVLAIGLNYKAHIEETGRDMSPHQIWFNKQFTCITGPNDTIERPVASDKVDYEGELVLVVSKTCRHVPAERAHEVIGGYMVGNDVSVRDWQRRTPTMQMGKSFDTHGPTGPWIVTADDIADPQDLTISTYVNDELRQQASTASMIHSIRDQIEHLTTAFTLEPGDLIFTGTPSGVGVAMDPPSFLEDGDVVRIEISDIGTIENRVENEVAHTVIV